MEKIENPLTVEQVVELVGLMQQSAQKDYEEALAKYDDPTYGEEFEDTLERKYNEGQADAFRTALDYFERALGEYRRGFDEGENQGGRNVLDYLSEIFDELDETDIWAEYMGEEEEEEKHPIFCPVCGSVGCVIDHEAKTEEILKFAQEHRNDVEEEEYPNAGEVLEAMRKTLPAYWRIELEYGDWISVGHPSFISDDQAIAFGTVNGYWAFNDTDADQVTGSCEGIYDTAEIVSSFWAQVAKFYPELLKGAK